MDHAPGFLKIVADAKTRVREITIADLRARQEAGTAPLLIDVREEGEWAKGHLPQARHIGKGVLERDIEAQVPNADHEIVLYCGGGFRSALAADSLQKMGYTQAFSLVGGWREWNEQGHPIER
jgi:rhodanese-related sulfurtransferase